jgi:heterodisulfide reductase subunit D
MDYTPRHLWRMVEAGLTYEVLNSSTFWFCTSCYACTNQCPRGIHPGETMLRLKQAVAEGEGGVMPENMARFGNTVVEYHNISGEANDVRLIWMENLDETERPAGRVGRRDAQVLYFIGCVSSFYPASYRIPQAFVQIMGRAGVDFTLLGGEEWCCGYPLLNAGMVEEMAKVAEYNLNKAHELGVECIVMTCPSCFHAWHNIYPELLGRSLGIEVVPAVQFLVELIEENRIEMGVLEKKVTYHDPCDLGRKGGVYDAPRFVLQHIPGVEFIEMREHGPNAACCGGGNLEAVEPTLVNLVAPERIVEAVAEIASDTYVTPGLLAQGIAYEFCRRGWLKPNVERLKGIYRPRLEATAAALREYLPGADWVEPEGGFFLGLTLPPPMNVANLRERAEKAGLSLSDGRGFFPQGGGERFLRLAFPALSEPEIREGISRLVRLVSH